jgi:hypothetical protein
MIGALASLVGCHTQRSPHMLPIICHRTYREVHIGRLPHNGKRLRRVGTTEPPMVAGLLEGDYRGPSGAFLRGGFR